jgi:probable HAF family extracellular repeat protein
MIGLGDLAGGGFNSNGLAISADGSTIVGYGQTSAANPEAFRWTAANGIVGLGVLPSGISIAGAVSADGSVVIGTDNGAPSASFRWTQADGLQVLTNAGQDMNSNAIAVSGDGSLVGGIDYDSPNGVSVKGAFLWDSVHGERLLKDILTGSGVDLSGWFLYDVTGISADGAIVTGEAVNADSEIEGFVANLVPEPSTLLLAAVGLAGLYFRR